MNAEPKPARILWSAVATLTLAVAVWWYVDWRSAPPPPPQIAIPGP